MSVSGSSSDVQGEDLQIITEEKGGEEGEADEGSGERLVRNEIMKEVIRGSQKMVFEETC